MKFLLYIFILTTGFAIAKPVKFTPDLIQSVEKKYLDKYKSLSSKQKQEKYLIAISELCELGEFAGAIQLAENGYKLTKPSLEYYDVFLTLLKNYGTIKRYNEVFEDLFDNNFRLRIQEDRSVIGDIVLDYMLANSLLPHELKPKVENIYKVIQEEEFRNRANQVQSIIYAKRGKYKEAIRLFKITEQSGLEEQLYYLFLKKMDSQPTVVSNPLLVQIYSDIVRIITTSPTNTLIDELKASEDIMKDTPLYEVIK